VLREQKWIDLDAKYRYGYQGKYAEKDEETGWDHFELREYDPIIGRWTTKDPMAQFYSPYIGMGNNPVSGTDPDGGLYEYEDRGGVRTKISDKGGEFHDIIHFMDGDLQGQTLNLFWDINKPTSLVDFMWEDAPGLFDIKFWDNKLSGITFTSDHGTNSNAKQDVFGVRRESTETISIDGFLLLLKVTNLAANGKDVPDIDEGSKALNNPNGKVHEGAGGINYKLPTDTIWHPTDTTVGWTAYGRPWVKTGRVVWSNGDTTNWQNLIVKPPKGK
jgi:RHS repeat-associated protein